MTLVEQVRFAFGAVRGHRLRSILTLLGFGIGVAAVVLLTALGEGARAYVTGEFMSLGSNLLIVLPGRIETSGAAPLFGGNPRDLTLGDLEAVRRQVPRARHLAPLSVGAAQAGYGDRRRQVTVLGTTSEYLTLRHMALSSGEFLPPLEADRAGAVAVIGETVRSELFGGESPLGKSIRVGEWRMRVIGVLEPKGMTLGMNMDEVVFVPVASAMKIFNQSSLFRILVEASAHADIDDVHRDVLKTLMARHAGEEDVTILTQDSMLASFNRILGALTLSLAGIAAISLSVAGIGIMNVMLVSVSERTAEIGLLKAIGAAPRAIQRVFLVEAVLLSLAGGALGLVVGYLGAGALGHAFPALPARPPGWAVTAAIVVSFGAGVAFGVMPARRAARMDPVMALARH